MAEKHYATTAPKFDKWQECSFKIFYSNTVTYLSLYLHRGLCETDRLGWLMLVTLHILDYGSN
jgi:hypothetical protein